jgi:hypothetical protein
MINFKDFEIKPVEQFQILQRILANQKAKFVEFRVRELICKKNLLHPNPQVSQNAQQELKMIGAERPNLLLAIKTTLEESFEMYTRLADGEKQTEDAKKFSDYLL